MPNPHSPNPQHDDKLDISEEVTVLPAEDVDVPDEIEERLKKVKDDDEVVLED